MDLFLDVERRSMYDEIAPVLLILAAPDKLRIKITVTPLVRHAYRVLLVLLHHRLIFSGGNILACRFVVLEGYDGLGVLLLAIALKWEELGIVDSEIEMENSAFEIMIHYSDSSFLRSWFFG